jgi:peptide/nickel transport system substrate-binding protein/2-iminobutanoate/2-iminopropanoate deaminase
MSMASVAKRIIRTDDLMVPIAHFSHALRVGNEIHLGATAGTDRTRRLAGALPGLADARAQADQMYRNMKLALGLLGAKMEDVVRLKVYLSDWRDHPGCDEAYAGHFLRGRPSRSVVGSWGFPLPFAVVEAELTAVVGGSSACRYDCAMGEDPLKALAHLSATLGHAGFGLRDVVSLNVTLADPRDHAALEAAFARVLAPPYPARTVSAAPLADPRMRVALEATAVRGGGEPVEAPGVEPWPGAASQAMLAGAHLFISGQPGIEAGGRMADGVAAQTRAAWRRIDAILRAASMERAQLVRTNNWLTDWRGYRDFNAAYGEFVEPPYPPRATVLAGLVPPAAEVQIEAIAHRGGGEATVLDAGAKEARG